MTKGAAASSLVLGLTLVRVFAPLTFIAFALFELPAVAGAALVEFGILFRAARRRGVAIASLYAGGWWAIMVAIPGVLLAAAPLVTYQTFGPPATALPAMAIVGAIVFLVGLLATLGLRGRGLP